MVLKNYQIIKVLALIICIILLLSGCKNTIPTGSDFEDVTYTVTIPGKTSSTVSENEPLDSEINSSQIELPSSTDSSSVAETVSEEDKVDDYVFGINKVKNVIKFHCTDSRLKTSDFIPSVAYLENGEARDTLFEGFAFIPGVQFVYDYGEDDGGMKPLTQKEWNTYIYNYEFRKGYNVDALDDAAGQLRNALEIPQYKVGIYLSIFYPVKSVTNWGTINGKTLNFKQNEQDRITAMKWMVDEQIKAFKERNYQNIELCGFYYYPESIAQTDMNILNEITDYVRSKELLTIWAPYHKAAGYSEWKNYGFDMAAMQANYFPGREDLPNHGPISRVTSNAAITLSRGMGFEMELCNHSNEVSITGFKQYMKYGVELGYMNSFHTYWMSGGIGSVKYLYNSTNDYIHSTYEELYKFIKGDLTSEEILIK